MVPRWRWWKTVDCRRSRLSKTWMSTSTGLETVDRATRWRKQKWSVKKSRPLSTSQNRGGRPGRWTARRPRRVPRGSAIRISLFTFSSWMRPISRSNNSSNRPSRFTDKQRRLYLLLLQPNSSHSATPKDYRIRVARKPPLISHLLPTWNMLTPFRKRSLLSSATQSLKGSSKCTCDRLRRISRSLRTSSMAAKWVRRICKPSSSLLRSPGSHMKSSWKRTPTHLWWAIRRRIARDSATRRLTPTATVKLRIRLTKRNVGVNQKEPSNHNRNKVLIR